MNFGWNHFYRPLPKPLQQLLTSLKGFILTISTAAFFSERPTLAFWVMVSGALIDLILNFFAEAPVETLEKTAARLERDEPELNVKVNIKETQND